MTKTSDFTSDDGRPFTGKTEVVEGSAPPGLDGQSTVSEATAPEPKPSEDSLPSTRRPPSDADRWRGTGREYPVKE